MLRISFLFVICLLFCSLVSSSSVTSNVNIGCGLVFNQSLDYFPIKSQVSYADGFAIDYSLSSKVITNKITQESFTLYHCDTPAPSSPGGKLFSVPVTQVATLDTTSVAYLEYLGQRLSIASVSYPDYITSSCILARIDDGLVASSPASGPTVQAQFGDFQADPTLPLSISTSPVYESTVLKRAEWIKFYGAFYNLEKEANDLYDQILSRYKCFQSLVTFTFTSTPSVAWVSYSNYGGPSWTFSNASYKRDLTEAAGGSLYVPQTATYTTAAEFLQASQNVDILIDETFFSVIADATLAKVLANYGVDSSITAATHPWINHIYREDGISSSASGLDWFDGAFVMADALLADMIRVVHPPFPYVTYTPVWFRSLNANGISEAVSSVFCPNSSSTTLASLSPPCATTHVSLTTTGGSSSTTGSSSSTTGSASTGRRSTSTTGTTGGSHSRRAFRR